MKLLIGDNNKINSYSLPSKIEKIYALNLSIHADKTVYDEVLNLKSDKNSWIIYADEKLQLVYNNEVVKYIILTSNMKFNIRFADMESFICVYVLPDFSDFKAFSILDVNFINIGKSNLNHIILNTLPDIALSINNGIIENKFQGLAYLNSHLFLKAKLVVGDTIFIDGIQIVYMGRFLLVASIFDNVVVNLTAIKRSEEENVLPSLVNDIEKNVKLYNESQLFVHTPRLKNEIVLVEINIDNPPSKDNSERMPAVFTIGSSAVLTITSATSLVSSVYSFAKGSSDVLTLVLESVIFGSMLVVGLFLPLLMERWEKNSLKKKEKLRQTKYQEYITTKQKEINNIVLKQENILKNNNIPLDKIEANILNNSNDIWNREITDNDFLALTLGIGNIEAKIKINAEKSEFTLYEDNLQEMALKVSTQKYLLKEVPITLSLKENKVVPIVFDATYSDDYIKSLILQIIYFHSAIDLKIVMITNEYNESKWEFLKYLAHNWNENYDQRFFATNSEEVNKLSMYLEQIYEGRKSDENKKYNEYYLLITDDFILARELTVINKIIDDNDNYGFSLLIFENSIKNIPSKFNSLIQIIDKNGMIIEKNQTNKEPLSFLTTYKVNLPLDKYAKIIANIPVNIKGGKYDIPSSLSFLDMYNVGQIEQLNVLSKWQTNNPTISLKAPVGMKENNKLIELDLHEKYHGPHGLIAGSTGSGKSEFIITFILSMAINYNPYEVQFVLIDYKGGGLAGAFENRETGVKIPHLIGTITNLDKNEMDRTLVSIKSELQRRQKIFNYAREKNNESTIDIYKYQRLFREGKVTEPLSHLFIISDEFAELKAEQPEFMDELISTARIGRSLGVHLILSTQKPSGVVDDQIWSNARFHVCLKVQTPEDSNELLKKPDAAYIKEVGRFYLQVGNDELYELGQSAYAGANYIPTDNVEKKLDDDIVFLSNTAETLKIINEEVKKEDTKNYGDQLTNIVKYLYNLALRENIKTNCLWLNSIPEVIYYQNIVKKYNVQSKPYIIEPVIGEYDNPKNQEQGLVTLPLSFCGNTYIAGISGSGKNTLLETIVYSIITTHSAKEVNLYIIDLGAGKLKEFQDAPQVGEVLSIDDYDKIKFLFYMLEEEFKKRNKYYSQNGGDFLNDVKSSRAPFPTMIVIINQFEVFKENFENIMELEFTSFTRNCNKVGIIFILSSNSTGTLGYVIDNNFPKKIVLNMTDSSDYQAFFPAKIVPKKNPGRGLIEMDQIYEFQIAKIWDDDVFSQNLNYVINKLKEMLNTKANKVPIVPDEVTMDILEKNINDFEALPLGVNIETAQISTYNFNKLLTVSCSERHIAIKSFLPFFVNLLTQLNNTKVIVINSLKNLHFDISNAKYYDSDFADVIKVINTNVLKYTSVPNQNNFFIIFIGYKQLQQYLLEQQKENSDVVTIDDLIINSKQIMNFKYLLYDKDSDIEYISDGKLDVVFKRSDGIWFGKNFDSQSVFDVIHRYDNATYGNGTITLVKNGKVEHVKFL